SVAIVKKDQSPKWSNFREDVNNGALFKQTIFFRCAFARDFNRLANSTSSTINKFSSKPDRLRNVSVSAQNAPADNPVIFTAISRHNSLALIPAERRS